MNAQSATATATLTDQDSVAYLGPQGTFTEVAMRSMASTGGARPVPLGTVDVVRNAAADKAVRSR